MHQTTPDANLHRESLEYQATALHALRSKLPPREQVKYFPDHFHQWVETSTPVELSNWLKGYGKRIRKAVVQASQRPANTLPITAYFRPQQS